MKCWVWGNSPSPMNYMKTSYWSELQGGVEFYPTNELYENCYWSEILDEMLGMAEFRHTNELARVQNCTLENELLE